jgi:hypothetical protein
MNRPLLLTLLGLETAELDRHSKLPDSGAFRLKASQSTRDEGQLFRNAAKA